MDKLIVFVVGAVAMGVGVFIGTAEHYEQKALRASCVAAHGHYFKVGDRRWNGLCVKTDGILWDRSK